MTSHNKPDTPDEGEKLIRHLGLLIGVLRQQMSDDGRRHQKAWWQYFVEPVVLTSLITVVAGGLIGGIITTRYQNDLKEREAQQAALRSRADQELLWYKEYLNQEQEVVRRAYVQLGACISASARLISQTGPAFRQTFAGRDKDAIEGQQRNIKHDFNQTRSKWVAEQMELGLLLSYYHPEQAGVGEMWAKIDGSLTAYLNCAERWNNDHQRDAPPPRQDEVDVACKELYGVLKADLDEMTKLLEASRQYPWKEHAIK
jgi:hypothetical protein